MFVKCYFQRARCFTNCFSFRNWKSNRLTGVKKDKEKIQLLKEQGWNNQQSETVWLNAFADETHAKKYNNLKSGGASWADAMAVMDIGGDATEGLTETQIKVYNQRWEKITGETTKKLMTTKAYKDADAEGREALVDKLNTYASAVAKAAEKEKALRSAGLTWDQTSTVMGTLGGNGYKARAITETNASEDVKLKALEVYLTEGQYKSAKACRSFAVAMPKHQNSKRDVLRNVEEQSVQHDTWTRAVAIPLLE